MATAKDREVTKTRSVLENYTAYDGVVLELTEDEAAYLAALLGWKVVGQDVYGTSIFYALRNLGFSSYKGPQKIRDKVNAIRDTMHGTVEIRKD